MCALNGGDLYHNLGPRFNSNRCSPCVSTGGLNCKYNIAQSFGKLLVMCAIWPMCTLKNAVYSTEKSRGLSPGVQPTSLPTTAKSSVC